MRRNGFRAAKQVLSYLGITGQPTSKSGYLRRGITRLSFNSALRLTFVLLLTIIDPFNAVEWTQLRSHDIWEQVQAPTYGWPKAMGRPAITVVYITPRGLADIGIHRRMNVRDQEDVLDNVVGLGTRPPRAVFVDVTFDQAVVTSSTLSDLLRFGSGDQHACDAAPDDKPSTPIGPDRFKCYVVKAASLTRYSIWKADRRCQRGQLAKLACIRSAGGLPLIFADPTIESNKRDIATRALDEVALISPVNLPRDKYPLAVSQASGARWQPDAFTPAALLYGVYCWTDHCKRSPLESSPGFPSSRGFSAPIDVVWGVDRRDSFTQLLAHYHAPSALACGHEARPGIGGPLLKAMFPRIRRRSEGPPLCPYTHAMPYSDLVGGRFNPDDAQVVLDNKLILVGESEPQSADWISAPIYGRLPGVFYHAMALDNLIQEGSDYQRVANPNSVGLSLQDLYALGWLGIMAVLSGTARILLNEPWLDPVSSGNNDLRRIMSRLLEPLKRWSVTSKVMYRSDALYHLVGSVLNSHRATRWCTFMGLRLGVVVLLFVAPAVAYLVASGGSRVYHNNDLAALAIAWFALLGEQIIAVLKPLAEAHRRLFDIEDTRFFGADYERVTR